MSNHAKQFREIIIITNNAAQQLVHTTTSVLATNIMVWYVPGTRVSPTLTLYGGTILVT